MTSKFESDERKYGKREYRTVATRLREINSKVDDISSRLDDHRHLLQEILDNTGRDNGHGTDWYDLYDESVYD